MLSVLLRRCGHRIASQVPKMDVLNVAEKNEAAKGIAQILSRNRFNRREGRSQYNKIYEFQHNLPDGNPVNMTMTSVSGHLLSLNFPQEFNRWEAIDSESLFFDANVVSVCPQQFTAIKETLEREIRHCRMLVIWTDCDREGENIGFEIIQVCQQALRRANRPEVPVRRAIFSEITVAAITRAWNQLADPDPWQNAAVECRSELDLRIGAAFTRFQTLLLRQRFPNQVGGQGQIVSYGSCQFPTLGFVVERYKAVEAFVPEPFWKLRMQHTKDAVQAEFHWMRGKLFEREPVQIMLDECLESEIATIVNVKSKPKEKWRPVALETVEMEKLGNRKLRFSARQVMQLAEKLYTKGFISYPRTETNKFPPELDLTAMVNEQMQDHHWGQFAAAIANGPGPTPRNGNKTDQAHPPIHPTKYARPGDITADEKRLYDLIVRHFLACVSRNASGHETVVDAQVAEEYFSATGLQILDRGYLEVYPYDRWETKVIGSYQLHERFNPDLVDMVEGNTQPPKLLTEADLIALMDKHGIGTDATHAEHIEKIKNRLYVGLRPDGRFVPGFLGLALVEGYDAIGHQMSKPNRRAELERDLKLICQQRKRKHEVLQEQLRKYHQIFVETRRDLALLVGAVNRYWGGPGGGPAGGQLHPPNLGGGPAGGGGDSDDDDQGGGPPPGTGGVQAVGSRAVKPCDKCAGGILGIRNTKQDNNFFIGCTSYPQCRNSVWLPKGTLTSLNCAEDGSTCLTCGPNTKLLRFQFKRGKRPTGFKTNTINACIFCDNNIKQWMTSAQTAADVGDANMGNNPSAPQCQCSMMSIKRTVTKAGPNKGRPFWTCSKPMHEKCGFFQWDDANNAPAPAQGGATQAQQSFHTQRPANNMNQGGDNATTSSYFGTQNPTAPQCLCNSMAAKRVVNKEGPNKGRDFWCCSKSAEERCNFFQWADENNTGSVMHVTQPSYTQKNNNLKPTAGGDRTTNMENYFPAAMNVAVPNCGCEIASVSRTVKKEGPNKGKNFWACPKGMGQGCNFFQWADPN